MIKTIAIYFFLISFSIGVKAQIHVVKDTIGSCAIFKFCTSCNNNKSRILFENGIIVDTDNLIEFEKNLSRSAIIDDSHAIHFQKIIMFMRKKGYKLVTSNTEVEPLLVSGFNSSNTNILYFYFIKE